MLTRLVPALALSTAPAGPGCETTSSGLLQEPVAALSSLAFVAAAAVIPVFARREEGRGAVGYAALVGSVGLGSFVQHGPDPAWSDVAHDTPLIAVLAFVAADAVADLTRRRRAPWWWLVPTTALIPLVLAAPRAGDAAQAGAAAVAVLLTLARARSHPEARRRIGVAVGLLAVGAAVGTLSRAGGPLCDPESVWQGHAAWHVLASAALLALAPVIGGRGGPAERGRQTGARGR